MLVGFFLCDLGGGGVGGVEGLGGGGGVPGGLEGLGGEGVSAIYHNIPPPKASLSFLFLRA